MLVVRVGDESQRLVDVGRERQPSLTLRLQLVDRPSCLQELGPKRKQVVAQSLQGLAGLDKPDIDCEGDKGGSVHLPKTKQGQQVDKRTLAGCQQLLVLAEIGFN